MAEINRGVETAGLRFRLTLLTGDDKTHSFVGEHSYLVNDFASSVAHFARQLLESLTIQLAEEKEKQ